MAGMIGHLLDDPFAPYVVTPGSAPPVAPGSAPPMPSTGAGDPDAFGRAWMASGGRTVADLQAFVQAHPEFGATLFGSKGDKVKFPGGQEFDAVYAAGAGGLGATWNPAGGAGSGGIGGTLIDPWTQAFHARSPEEIANDPAYKFQLAQGLQGIERGAAAKGTLLTGGTLKALDQYGQGLASTYNDKYYGRDMGEYLLNRENFYNNQDRPFEKLSQLGQYGKPT